MASVLSILRNPPRWWVRTVVERCGYVVRVDRMPPKRSANFETTNAHVSTRTLRSPKIYQKMTRGHFLIPQSVLLKWQTLQ
eukprot:4270593-Amphidinium_carterae.1